MTKETITPLADDDAAIRSLAQGYRFVSVLIVFFGIGSFLFFAYFVWAFTGRGAGAIPRETSIELVAIALAVATAIVLVGVLGEVAARGVNARTHLRLIALCAVLYLFFVPIGTVVGLLAMAQLSDPAFRARFVRT